MPSATPAMRVQRSRGSHVVPAPPRIRKTAAAIVNRTTVISSGE